MAAIDFITALGRLLRDGALRDALALNPNAVAAQLGLPANDRPALQQLVPADLEFQAQVLLRKRLDLVRSFLPKTCRQLATHEWPIFLKYARDCWPQDSSAPVNDALGFCRHLKQYQSQSVCAAEWNRLRFVASKQRLGIHLVNRTTRRSPSKLALQVLFRTHCGRWHEFQFYPGL